MRAFVYFLSLLIVFAPIYANAVLPFVPAILGHATGEIAVGTGKAVIKKISPQTKKDLANGALGVCAKNPAIASFCGGVVSAVVGNDWTIENNNTTNNNDVDVNIYRNSNQCKQYQTFISSQEISGRVTASQGSVSLLSDYYRSLSELEADLLVLYQKPYNSGYGYKGKVKYWQSNDVAIKQIQDYKKSNSVDKHNVANGEFKVVLAKSAELSPLNFSDYPALTHTFYHVLVVVNNCSDNKVSDDDLVNIFNNLSDDDITNIYNYDYSQHQNITVNNNTTNGNNINNSKNNFDKNYNEKSLSENATNKMKNKDKDYTIDKINDENCTKNESNEYDKCGKDKDKTDEDTKCKENEVLVNGECREKKGDEQDNHDEQVILFCKENPELCEKIFQIEDNTDELEEKSDSILDKLKEIFDWVDDEADEPTDTEVEIEEPETEKISGDKIDFKADCPDGIGFTYTMFGNTYNAEIDVRPLCEFAKGIKPYMVGSALLSSVYIIVGIRRD